jgi:transcriptional regulator with XRE-family HTH domain
MSATYLGFLERGENIPTLTIALRLADALMVAPVELIKDAAKRRTSSK